MIRKKNIYTKPKKSFEAGRIQEENELKEKYGLKNKKEIWKTLAKVNYYRKRAMELAQASEKEQQVLFNKLKALGLKADAIADVLAMKVEDLLERRLPTILFKGKVADTTKQGRQMVVHKRVLISGKVVNTPSYLVPVAEEKLIKIKPKKEKKKLSSKTDDVGKRAPDSQQVQSEKDNNKTDTKVADSKSEVKPSPIKDKEEIKQEENPENSDTQDNNKEKEQ